MILVRRPAHTERLNLGSSLSELARARTWLRTVLNDHDVPEPHQARLILTGSELVANALEHAAPPAWIRVTIEDRVVTLAVCDHSPHVTLPTRRDPDNPRGRGLHLVQRLATDWGVRAHERTKTVWCSFDLTAPAPQETR
ncbi:MULTISPECIES: ATP-binding protein [Cellulosimicrobium]|uniref:ATP-binding protein n=1 Tax=Cellulosimicrobium TaxID=157920 RepID=UPI001BA65603|nr:ATP-binding protein [Cellulosimicrobium cellulans]QUC01955.1 ATP-binding protein [Cellulosimicrobium cellulans]